MDQHHQESQDVAARTSSFDQTENNVIRLAPESSQPKKPEDAGVLVLVRKASEAIKLREEQAVTLKTEARDLVRRTLDELRLTKQRIQMAKDAQRVAEAHALETDVKFKELEKKLKENEAALATAQKSLADAELNAKSLEARAQEAEHALACLEEAIHTGLLMTWVMPPKKSSTAA